MILEGLWQGLQLLWYGDDAVWAVVLLTIEVSATATVLSLLLGIPAGVVLALARFPGKGLLVSLVNTGMGLPPVVVGLFVSILLWRSGPLGTLGLLYTPAAMVLAQSVIAWPVITGLTFAAISSLEPNLSLQILSLGATRWQLLRRLVLEARLAIMGAVIAGFGSVVSEVGASMMVGGNVKDSTRVLTTATVMEVSKGNFDVAIALSLVLLLLTYGVTMLLTLMQRGWRKSRNVPASRPQQRRSLTRKPGEPSGAAMTLQDVQVTKGQRIVLQIDQWTLRSGSITAVIGPNGAGKSTFLRLLHGLERMSQGQVLFQGQPVYGQQALELRRQMAMVFQTPCLYQLSVYDNIAEGLRLRALPEAQVDEAVGYWAERLGIAHLLGRSAQELSGGEAQRLSLARALAYRPALFLMDEPFASLDPPTREELYRDLREVLAEEGITAVIVTHALEEMFLLADQVVFLDQGSIRQQGTPEELLQSPVDGTVADFLGKRPLIAGTIVARTEQTMTVLTPTGQLVLPLAFNGDGAVLLCLREGTVGRPGYGNE
ncbi:ABC transporter permease [Heliophilum fasciatum]